MQAYHPLGSCVRFTGGWWFFPSRSVVPLAVGKHGVLMDASVITMIHRLIVNAGERPSVI